MVCLIIDCSPSLAVFIGTDELFGGAISTWLPPRTLDTGSAASRTAATQCH